MRCWQVGRWVLLAVWALAMAVLFARTFSGPEDAWIRDASGRWVAHGHPRGPAPAASYQPPASERAVPIALLALVGGGLIAATLLSGRSPAGADSLNRGIRYFGALSITSTVLAVGIAVGLVVSVLSGPRRGVRRPRPRGALSHRAGDAAQDAELARRQHEEGAGGALRPEATARAASGYGRADGRGQAEVSETRNRARAGCTRPAFCCRPQRTLQLFSAVTPENTSVTLTRQVPAASFRARRKLPRPEPPRVSILRP